MIIPKERRKRGKMRWIVVVDGGFIS